MTWMEKAFAKRFDFDSVRTSQLQTDVKSNATANAPWDEYICTNVYIIQRGAFVLLVQDIRAMRRPLHCGASDEASAPRFFFVRA